jgi:hypothetical protein
VRPGLHNESVTYPQAGAVCPKCGSADQVHSIQEWATMAQANMGDMWQPGAPMPGYPAQPPSPQPGPGGPSGFPDPSAYQQSGFPDPSQYQQSGFPDPSQQPPPSPAGPQPTPQPGYQAGQPTPQPGYQPGPQPDYLPGPESWQNQPPPRTRRWEGGGGSDTFEGAIAEALLGAATKKIGRVIGRKVREAYNERVAPAMAARQEAVLNDRMAIAQRHPDLRACLNDQVVFLVGGTRTLPLASAMRVRTVQDSDALVAQLRG